MEKTWPGRESKHPGGGLTNAIQQLVCVSNTRCVFLFVSATVKCGVALFRKQLINIKKEKSKEAEKGALVLDDKLGGRSIVAVAVVCFYPCHLDSVNIFVCLLSRQSWLDFQLALSCVVFCSFLLFNVSYIFIVLILRPYFFLTSKLVCIFFYFVM